MKVNKLFLISIFLLAVLTICAVNATDAADDAAAIVNEESSIEIPQSDVELSSSDENSLLEKNGDLIVDTPKNAKCGEHLEVNLTVPLPSDEIYDNSFYIYDLDNKLDDGSYDEISCSANTNGNSSVLYFTLNKLGVNNLRFVVDCQSGNLITFQADKKITVEDYVIDMYEVEEATYGQDCAVHFEIPNFLHKNLKITLNNEKEFTFRFDDELSEYPYHFTFSKKDLKYGINNITVSYPGDEKNKAHTFYFTINYVGIPEFNISSSWNKKSHVTLELPSDATGQLIVSIDDVNQTPVKIQNGKADFEVPTLDLGNHEYCAYYINDNKYPIGTRWASIETVPYIYIPKYIGVDGGNVIIEMPQKYNGNAEVYLYNDDGSSQTISSGKITKGKATIPIKLTILDEDFYSSRYDVHVTIDTGDYAFTLYEGVTVDVLTGNPSELMDIENNDVFKLPNQELFRTADYDCSFSLTVDGKQWDVIKDSNYFYIDASSLSYGSHSFKFTCIDDGFFKGVSKTGSFNVEEMIVKVPDVVKLDDTSYEIEVYLPTNLPSGKLTYKVDGKTLSSENVVPSRYNDRCYEWCAVDNLKYGISNYEVTFKTGDRTITKKGSVNVSYTMGVEDKIRYGEENMTIYLPSDIKSGFSVSIDGVDQKVIIKKTSGMDDYRYVKTSPDLSVGNHTVVIKYNGDNNYPARSVSQTVKVVPIVIVYEDISLYMPENAKGNLTVFIKKDSDDAYKLYANVKAAGYKSFTFDDLHYGQYQVKLNYTGNDYIVEHTGHGQFNNIYDFTVNPKVTYINKVLLGDSVKFSVDIPGRTGRFTIPNPTGEEAESDLKNGKATVTLSNLDVGMNDLEASIDLDLPDGDYETYNPVLHINVVSPIIAKNANVVYANNAKYSVNIKDLDGNAVKTGKVTFYILDGKKQILKKTADIKNGVATLSYKITQGVKKYTIKTVLNKASVSKKLTVKHLVSLKKVTVKKSAKKLVLQATLGKVNGKYVKNKQVTFKFNGKTYKAKTNKKGVAKVTVKKAVLKNLKIGKKVTYQATYLKDTVKKTAVVKK